MIHNMVLEPYPRDEDDDASASASDSEIGEDKEYDVVITVSASSILESSASHNHIVFGSFESSITPISNPLIKPEFDGISIKIGEISCTLLQQHRRWRRF